jgi:hypothetical protein
VNAEVRLGSAAPAAASLGAAAIPATGADSLLGVRRGAAKNP